MQIQGLLLVEAFVFFTICSAFSFNMQEQKPSKPIVWLPQVVRQPPHCQLEALTRRFREHWWIPQCDPNNEELYKSLQTAEGYKWCVQANGTYIDYTLHTTSGEPIDCNAVRDGEDEDSSSQEPPTTEEPEFPDNFTFEPFDFGNENDSAEVEHNTEYVVILDKPTELASTAASTTTIQANLKFPEPPVPAHKNGCMSDLFQKTLDNNWWLPNCDDIDTDLYATLQMGSGLVWCATANGMHIEKTLQRESDPDLIDCDSLRVVEATSPVMTSTDDESSIIPDDVDRSCLVELLKRKTESDASWTPNCIGLMGIKYAPTQRSRGHTWCVHATGQYIEWTLRKLPEPPANCEYKRENAGILEKPESTADASMTTPAVASTTTPADASTTTAVELDFRVYTNPPNVQRQRIWTEPSVRQPPDCQLEALTRRFRQDPWIPTCEKENNRLYAAYQKSQFERTWCSMTNGKFIKSTLRNAQQETLNCTEKRLEAEQILNESKPKETRKPDAETSPPTKSTTTATTTTTTITNALDLKPPKLRFPDNCTEEYHHRMNSNRTWIPTCDHIFPTQYSPIQTRGEYRWCVEANGDYIEGTIRSRVQPLVNCLMERIILGECAYPVHLEQIDNSVLLSDDLIQLVMGSKVNVQCHAGYKMISGTSTWICARNLVLQPIPKPGETRRLPYCAPTCGEKSENSIVWPWLVNVENRCTGTIVDKRLIMTSATCLTNGTDLLNVESVTLNVNNRNDYNEDHINFLVSDVILHPEYGSNDQYNIALLKLDQDIVFTKDVMPVCLPRNIGHYIPLKPGNFGTTIGWNLSSKLPRDTVIEASDFIQPLNTCGRAMNTAWKKKTDLVEMDLLCTNERDNSTISDEGAPFMMDYGKNEYTLLGIMSSSKKTKTSHYKVYTIITPPITGWIHAVSTSEKKAASGGI